MFSVCVTPLALGSIKLLPFFRRNSDPESTTGTLLPPASTPPCYGVHLGSRGSVGSVRPFVLVASRQTAVRTDITFTIIAAGCMPDSTTLSGKCKNRFGYS